MAPSTQQRRSAGPGQALSIGVLVGVLVVVFGTVTVVSVYLTRVTSTVESMARTEPLGGYVGRPEKAVPREGSTAPIDYLVTIAGEDDDLLAVQLVRLSGDRHNLTLIGLPSDLLVPYDPGQPQQTLADWYRQDGAALARQVELLAGVPTDHQIRVGLSGLSEVVDTLGGLQGIGPAGRPLDGRGLLRYVADADDGPGRVQRAAEVTRAVIARLGMADAVSNPMEFDSMLRALEDCTLVDLNLTVEEFEETLMDSSVSADGIGMVTLGTIQTQGGRMAMPSQLAQLRKVLDADTVAAVATPIAALTAPSGSPTPRR